MTDYLQTHQGSAELLGSAIDLLHWPTTTPASAQVFGKAGDTGKLHMFVQVRNTTGQFAPLCIHPVSPIYVRPGPL